MNIKDYDKDRGADAFAYLLHVYSRRLEEDADISGCDLVDNFVWAYENLYKEPS